jgi:hypothetical protein
MSLKIDNWVEHCRAASEPVRSPNVSLPRCKRRAPCAARAGSPPRTHDSDAAGPRDPLGNVPSPVLAPGRFVTALGFFKTRWFEMTRGRVTPPSPGSTTRAGSWADGSPFDRCRATEPLLARCDSATDGWRRLVARIDGETVADTSAQEGLTSPFRVRYAVMIDDGDRA